MGGRGGSGRSSAGLIKVPVVDAKEMADMDLRDAYQDRVNINRGTSLATFNQGQGPWITLLELRTALSVRGWDREKQDREILRFIRERKAVASPLSNQKVMTDRVRNAAIHTGGQDKHIISFL